MGRKSGALTCWMDGEVGNRSTPQKATYWLGDVLLAENERIRMSEDWMMWAKLPRAKEVV